MGTFNYLLQCERLQCLELDSNRNSFLVAVVVAVVFGSSIVCFLKKKKRKTVTLSHSYGVLGCIEVAGF